VNCFYHRTVPAVGTCKSCGKGLCPDCAVDLGKGLACAGHCEAEVRAVIQMTEYSIAMTDSRKANMRGYQLGSGYLYVAIGIIFIGVSAVVHDAVTLIFLLPMGVIFLAYGAYVVRQMLRLPK